MKPNQQRLSISDVLLVLAAGSRTGELTVEDGNNLGTLLLWQGKILTASSPYSRAIGDLLVDDGLITESELIETLKLQKRNTYEPLGTLLMKMGKISFEIVEMMVHEQIRSSMDEFKTWDDASYSFTEKEVKPRDGINLGVREFLPEQVIVSGRALFVQESGQPEAANKKP
jgi:hypothetical protein